MSRQEIRDDEHCFCCGEKNDRGLHLEFSYPKSGTAETSLVIPDYFSGWKNITHGGLISMLLDETMAHACKSRELLGVTAELIVRFKTPLPVGTKVRVHGSAAEPGGRLIKTEAVVSDEAGTVYATGRAKFMVMG
jgi:uncharacterized protein (TIGR00369 family)